MVPFSIFEVRIVAFCFSIPIASVVRVVKCPLLLPFYKDMWSHLNPMQIIWNNILFQDPWFSHVCKALFAIESDIHKLQGLKSGCLLGWASLVVKNPLAKMQEMQVWALGQEGPLEKVMATHSRILAWRIPWTEKLGRPLSIGSQKSQTWPSD